MDSGSGLEMPMARTQLIAQYPRASILVLDDERDYRLMLERILTRAGYNDVRVAADGATGIEMATTRPPDLLLTDFNMPGMDGIEVIQQLRVLMGSAFPHVIMLTADHTMETKARALSCGARDFIAKPFDHLEALLRIQNLIDLRMSHRAVQDYNQMLEVRVRERTSELDYARVEALEKLGLAGEFRDDDTGKHTRRVGTYAKRLAEIAGMEPADVEMIGRAAPLHDVGKIAIPDSILLKPGPLTDSERHVMQMHTIIGAQLLEGTGPLFQMAEQIAQSHHERWDGSGYPDGSFDEDTPFAARIVGLVDFFDAVSNDRPYRAALPRETIVNMIEDQTGKHFDPILAPLFLRSLDDIVTP